MTTDVEPVRSSEEASNKADEAASLVKRYMMGSLGLGLIPFPLIDLAGLTLIQLQLLAKLASLYEVDYSKQSGKSIIASLVGGSSSTLASAASTRLLYKFIPGPGWVANAVSVGVFAGASTYALGKVFVQHFESGGTFLTFDPKKVREYYAKQFARGTQEVRETFVGVKP